MLHTHHIGLRLSPLAPLPCPLRHRPSPLSPLFFVAFRQSALASAFVDTEGPVEIPSSSSSSLFATDDNPTPLQTATSVLLTGSITVFLFRLLRKRTKRAKELRVRSTGTREVKGLKEEALDSLKVIGVGPVEAKGPPSPVQALLGGISAGVIAVILYKFTTTVEASLNRQTISDNFSVNVSGNSTFYIWQFF